MLRPGRGSMSGRLRSAGAPLGGIRREAGPDTTGMTEPFGRRTFLGAALAAGAAALVPAELARWSAAAAAADPDDSGGIFLTDTEGHPRRSTCVALCSRIVPTGSDPRRDPGANEAGAVVFIDRFLSAFELPASLADNPGIYLHGPFSGRNPYPDPANGRPSSRFPPDDFVSPDGQHHYLHLTPFQELSWRVQLYGTGVLQGAAVSPTWRSQVGSLIPLANPTPLRKLYAEGLDAFEAAARARYGTSYARATVGQQDELLAAVARAAGNAGTSGHQLGSTGNDLTSPTGSGIPAGASSGGHGVPAAAALFPQLVVHTYQACYAQPAYGGNRDGIMWRAIGWEGDTQPLGNSVYDRSIAGPGRGPNAGFGDPEVYLPRGGYRQYRPVSFADPPSAGSPSTDPRSAEPPSAGPPSTDPVHPGRRSR